MKNDSDKRLEKIKAHF